MHEHEKSRITRKLILRLLMILVLCAGIFGISAFLANRRSARTIEAVGDIYMHSMSEEIAFHVATTVNLYLRQLEAVMEDIEEGRYDRNRLEEELAEDMRLRDFDYLALCSARGEERVLYGSGATAQDPERFLGDLEKGEWTLTLGTGSSGEKMVLVGRPGKVLKELDGNYIALVGGIREEELSETLSLNTSDTLVTFYIIDGEGNSVIQSGDAEQENYFDRLRREISDNGDQYVEELKRDMEATLHFSRVLMVDGERRHLHCTKLSNTEWFLIVVMPYGSLDLEISGLGRGLLFISFAGFAVVLAALLWAFRSYFRELRCQMEQLDKVRQEAVDASRAKSEFLSNMSHDIRTPMNAVVGMTAIATANIDDKEQVRSCLKKISMSSRHLLGLINDVLDMSRIESGRLSLSMDQISLREVMDGIVSIIQPQVNIRKQKFDVLIRDITTEDVCCDSVRLNQVLLNLLGNAVKFTPEGGSILLTVYEEASPKGESCVRLHLMVEDNGIGMTPEFMEKIFEAFAREDVKRVQKTEGSGLGMAITKYIVDAMGGTITVESQLNKGSCFHVILDLEKARVQEVDMILPQRKVLVVDDDPHICESTASFLKAMGLCADWEMDGESALRRIRQQDDRGEGYQLVLTDWRLPGMDGIALTKEIRRSLGEEIPVLLISAYEWSEIRQEARAAGVSGYLSKPLFKSTLFYGLKPFVLDETGAQQDAEEIRVESAEPETDFTGRHILLAEDNDLNWEIARELLSSLGMELERAENGKICLDQFSRSEVGFYDAILMDVRMPVMNGYEATRAIRSLGREDARTIPILAMTADAFAEDVKNCLECGMNAHLAKPVDIREVTRLLGKYMR